MVIVTAVRKERNCHLAVRLSDEFLDARFTNWAVVGSPISSSGYRNAYFDSERRRRSILQNVIPTLEI